MILKVKENLFIVDGRVISYETEVARIKKGEIVVKGKYSRATSKQLFYLSRLTGMSIVTRPVARTPFFKFHIGVKCDAPSGNVIRPSAAQKILHKLKVAGDLKTAAVFAWAEISAHARSILRLELAPQGWTEDRILSVSADAAVLEQIGVL